jgi:hypothetical protein
MERTKESSNRKPKGVWRRVWPICALIVTIGASMVAGDGRRDRDDDDGRDDYAIGLWGDMPYSDVQAQVGVPNLIADMNRQDLQFTVHDGDLKGGNGTPGSVTPTTCVNETYTQALGFLNALRAPAILTPGDNDWTDCDRPSNGGFSSLERLDHERDVFFGDNRSLGRRRIQMIVQTAPLCLGLAGNVPCVENRRWHLGGVTYATLNIQGSCNNLCDTAPDAAEWAARNAANIVWLHETFQVAKQRGSAAVMIISQANPGWHPFENDASPRNPVTLVQLDAKPDGFRDYLLALRAEVIAFARPVAYVHGDTHTFRIDKPLFDAQGRRLDYFADGVTTTRSLDLTPPPCARYTVPRSVTTALRAPGRVATVACRRSRPTPFARAIVSVPALAEPT